MNSLVMSRHINVGSGWQPVAKSNVRRTFLIYNREQLSCCSPWSGVPGLRMRTEILAAVNMFLTD